MRTTTTLLTVIIIATTVPAASALTLRTQLQPIVISSSSSSSNIALPILKNVPLASSSSSSSSSATSGITANPMGSKAINKPSSSKEVEQYCMFVAMTMQKGTTLSSVGEYQTKVDQTMDLLKKANAICESMGFTSTITFSEGSFSSSSASVQFLSGSFSSSSSTTFWVSSGSFSSSSGGMTVLTSTEQKLCKNLGKTTTRNGVSYCKYSCGNTVKMAKCPTR